MHVLPACIVSAAGLEIRPERGPDDARRPSDGRARATGAADHAAAGSFSAAARSGAALATLNDAAARADH
jgi:hypothetical protein